MIKTFNIELDRRNAYVTPADVPDALGAFGTALVKVFVNPCNFESIKGVIPDGIELEQHPGVAGWELMGVIKDPQEKVKVFETVDDLPWDVPLPPENHDVAIIPDSPVTPKQIATPYVMPVKRGRGRPVKAGKVDRTTLWRRAKKMHGGLL